MSQSTERKEYKVMLFGASNTGKTTWLYNLINCNDSVSPTIGAEVHPYMANIDVKFNIWDVAGDESRMGLSMGLFSDADAVILFYNTEDNLNKYYDLITKYTKTKVIHAYNTTHQIDVYKHDRRPITKLLNYFIG